MHLTRHAIERYQKRWAAHLSLEEAGTELASLATRATRMRERSICGDEQWIIDSAIVLVVRCDPGRRADPVVVTVLPWHASPRHVDGLPADEAEILETHLAEQRYFEARRQAACVDCFTPATHYSHKRDVLVCAEHRRLAELGPEPGRFHSLKWYLKNRAPRQAVKP